MARTDKQWLARRGSTWFVVKHVPRALWTKITPGKTVRRLVKTTGTGETVTVAARREAM